MASGGDKVELGEVLALAAERKKAQEAWNALTVKVPEYAPWAPHAYRRLMHQFVEAQKIYANIDKNYCQQEVNQAASLLSAAINTMRPGNLPEPEDLYPLTRLLRQADRIPSGEVTPALTETVSHARMVVSYVNDGSGTHDMIRNALEKLRNVLN